MRELRRTHLLRRHAHVPLHIQALARLHGLGLATLGTHAVRHRVIANLAVHLENLGVLWHRRRKRGRVDIVQQF